jgi:hypothetical protein
VVGDKAPFQVKNDDLFDSIDGLMRGALAFRKEVGLVAPGCKQPAFNLGALLVVVEGPLYYYSVGATARMTALRRVQQASVLLRMIERDHRFLFRVDFVRAKYVASYLELLRDDAKAIVRFLEPSGELLRESVERFGHTDRGDNRD